MQRILRAYAMGVAVLIVWAGCATEAKGFGMGFYASGYSGTVTWTEGIGSWDTDVDRAGFGLVMDSNLAMDRVFNYRMRLGYERGAYEIPFGTLDTDGFRFSNTFGFGVVRTRVVRLWLGPMLDFSYESFADMDWSTVGVNTGPALGLNLNFGPVITLAFTTGYRVGKTWFVSDDLDEFDTDETGFFGNLALIFRMGDQYRRR